MLECNLIKEYRPKYNTMLKDDKAYPFIRVTLQEEYPRVLFSRTMKKDKSKYYGPYTSAAAVKETIELIRRLYHLRSCSRKLPAEQGKERPLPLLSYPSVQGSLPGMDLKRGLPEAGGSGSGLSQREFPGGAGGSGGENEPGIGGTEI